MMKVIPLLALGVFGYSVTTAIISKTQKIDLPVVEDVYFEPVIVTPEEEQIRSVPSDRIPKWAKELWNWRPWQAHSQPPVIPSEVPDGMKRGEAKVPEIPVLPPVPPSDPCGEWRSLYPNLANQLKPEQSCYD